MTTFFILLNLLPWFSFIYNRTSACGDLEGTYDITQDGNLDVNDIVQVIKVIIGSVPETEVEKCIFDGNGDGSLDVNDVVAAITLIINTP